MVIICAQPDEYPALVSRRIIGFFCFRSDDFRGASFSASQGAEAYSVSMFGNYVSSDGYRENNDLKQKNLTAELRRHGDRGDFFVHLYLDNQPLDFSVSGRRSLFGKRVWQLCEQ